MKNSQFLSHLVMMKNFTVICKFFGNGLKSQQYELSNFFGTESSSKGLPLTSKAANGYFGQIVCNWISGNNSRFEKVGPDANNKGFT